MKLPEITGTLHTKDPKWPTIEIKFLDGDREYTWPLKFNSKNSHLLNDFQPGDKIKVSWMPGAKNGYVSLWCNSIERA